MNKITLVVIIGVIVSVLVLPLFVMAQSTTSPSLNRIWQTILDIKREITDIKSSMSNLEQQVNNRQLETRIAIFNITTQTSNGVNVSCKNDEIATGGGTDSWGDTGHAGILEFYPINERTYYAKSSIILGTPSVGAWNFNEGSGNIAYDSSRRGSDGVIKGAEWSLDIPSGMGRSLRFSSFGNGTAIHNFVNVKNSPELNFDGRREFTFETMFKLPSEFNTGGPIILKTHPSPTSSYSLSITSSANDNRGYVEFKGTNSTVGSTTVSLLGSTVLERNRWYHLGANYDGEALRLYLDGQLDGERFVGSLSIDDPNQRLIIGANSIESQSTMFQFFGWLDDIKVSNRYYDLSNISNRDYGDLRLICVKY